jgi:hypothetical protein
MTLFRGLPKFQAPSGTQILTAASLLVMAMLTASAMLAFPSFFAARQAGAFTDPNEPDFNIAAAGDWADRTPETDQTVANIESHNPEIVLGLGDYSYSSDSAVTTTWWNTRLADLHDNHFNGAEGNHDSSLSSTYKGFFERPGASSNPWYYSFDKQNVHFIAINPIRDSYGVGSTQYNFIKSDLEAAHADSSIGFIIVYFHEPMVTSPSSHGVDATLRDAYQPLFDANGVDLVLEAHNHNYQRSYPIKYDAANPTVPIKTGTSTNSYPDPSDPVYALVGTAGNVFYSLGTKPSYMVTQQNTDHGYLDIAITEQGRLLTGKFFPNGGGAAMDTFTINKYQHQYHFEPYFTATGSNNNDIADAANLRLTSHSISAFFRTTQDVATGSFAFIANKGGNGIDTPGQNQNYGLWMDSNQKLSGGFEESNGVNHYLTSGSTYNDGKWHLALETYDATTGVQKLYVDNIKVAETTISPAVNPDNTGTQPLRSGMNSRSTSDTFVGDIDELRVWNRALNGVESPLVATDGRIIYEDFGGH